MSTGRKFSFVRDLLATFAYSDGDRCSYSKTKQQQKKSNGKKRGGTRIKTGSAFPRWRN